MEQPFLFLEDKVRPFLCKAQEAIRQSIKDVPSPCLFTLNQNSAAGFAAFYSAFKNHSTILLLTQYSGAFRSNP
jgi:hypothetical protein